MLPPAWGRLKAGIVLCWLSLLTLPVGVFVMGGPCAGLHNLYGSLILLPAGLLSGAMPVYGISRIFPSFRLEGLETQAFMRYLSCARLLLPPSVHSIFCLEFLLLARTFATVDSTFWSLHLILHFLTSTSAPFASASTV
jgi:hypothetical protein